LIVVCSDRETEKFEKNTARTVFVSLLVVTPKEVDAGAGRARRLPPVGGDPLGNVAKGGEGNSR
jgi:hypothetical protein